MPGRPQIRRGLHPWCSERGSTAVEFALVIPLLALLTIGAIYMAMAINAIVSLHFATQDTARCASVKTTICTAGNIQSYGQGKYKGPTLSSLTFTLTAAAAAPATDCGNKVVGTGTFSLNTGLGRINLPMSATSCYPSSTG